MISILIAIVKNKYLKVISFIRNNFKVIAVIISMILAAFCFYLHDKLIKKNLEIDRLLNNYEFYMNQTHLLKEQNRVLQLSVLDFKDTKDSLITEIKDVLKKLKIKEKELVQTQLLKLEIKHDTTIIVKSNNFNIEIKPNSLTSIIINKKDSILNHKISIKNSQVLCVTSKREYRNKYKNWFVRLFHFDFKKKNIYKYQIHNSNDLIEIQNTRLVEIKK